jgi:tetratricopeptide (TPR) repeat protein
MSGFGRRLLSSIRDAVTSGIQSLQASPLPGQAALTAQLAQARSDLEEGRAQDVVDRLESTKEALVLLLSATSATLGSAYDKLSLGSERDKAFRDAVNLFKMKAGAAAPSPEVIVAIVPALKARGKQAQAIEALREVAAGYPEDVSVAHLLATELEATGDPGAAAAYAELASRLPAGDVPQQVHYLKRATELDRDDPELQARLGTALLRVGNPEAAVAELQAAIPRLPPDHEANVSLAEALRTTGHPADALELINAIIQKHGDRATRLLVRADIYHDLNHPELGLADLDRVLDLSPDSMNRVNAQRARAELLTQLGRYPEAVLALDEVLSSTPDDGEVILARARARYAARDFVAAETDFADAAKAAETAGNASLEMTALSWHGETLRILRRYPEALSALNRALAVGPPSAFALGTKGQVLTALGQPAEGREALADAAAADPGLTWVHAALADTCRLEGQPEKALAELDLADQSGPTIYSLYVRGQVLGALRRDREAAEVLRQAWVLEPGPGIADELSSILGRLGTHNDLKESLAIIDQALEMQPSAVSLLARRADTLRMLGRHAEALAAADQFLRDNHSADVSGLKALILADLGRAAEALELADGILAKESGNLFAQYAKIEALVVLRRYDEALADTESMLARIPDDYFATVMKATIF